MYGRNNIFSQGSSGGNNSGYNNNYNYSSGNSNNNNYGYGNGNGSNYQGGNNSGRGRGIGSQRLQYKYEQPPSYLISYITQWKDYAPGSIVCRQQTLHLSTTELRIEDYFLIRKRQLRSQQEDRVREAIRKDSFNGELIQSEIDRLPPVSDERPLDLDAIRGRGGNSNSGYNSGGNSGYNMRSSGSSNIFSGNGNSNSISNNIFSQNSRGGSGGGNIFSGGNNSYGNNNNNNSSNNSGNIFSSNRGSSGSSGNIFNSSNNNNNSGRGSNIFGNNGNNSSGGNNIFSNNNNRGSSNPFNNNNNNNSNSGGNNIFNRGGGNNIFNNSNNNGGNNNIFGNRSNGGNNLFSNTNNNNNNNGLTNQFMAGMQYLFQQNNRIMQSLTAKIAPDQQIPEKDTTPSPIDTILGKDLFDIELFLNEPRRRMPQQAIIIAKPQWVQEYANMVNSQEMGQSRLVRASRVSRVNGSRLTNNRANSQILNNQSTVGGSRLIDNQPRGSQIRNTQSRLIRNDEKLSVNLSKRSTVRSTTVLPDWSGECVCDIELEVEWADDVGKVMPPSKIKTKIKLPNLHLSDGEWVKNLVSMLKREGRMVRLDACLNVTYAKEVQGVDIEFEIRGILLQKIINLSEDYKVCYSQIRNGLLYNLVISNEFGSIAWERPINLKQLDFVSEENILFEVSENTIVCELDALNSKCTVNFVGLPRQYQLKYGQDQELDRQLRERLGNEIQQAFNGDFQFVDMWKDHLGSGWTMLVKRFPIVTEQND